MSKDTTQQSTIITKRRIIELTDSEIELIIIKHFKILLSVEGRAVTFELQEYGCTLTITDTQEIIAIS